MNLLRINTIVLLLLLSVAVVSGGFHTDKQISQEIKNLTAFAKLYGYVKYFHPSDEAWKINWDKFAIHGVKTVKNARNQKELKESLDFLFSPIAPSFSISLDTPSEPFLSSYLRNLDQDTSALHTVAWQHLGVDLNDSQPAYVSRRVNASDETWDNNIILVRAIKQAELKGKQYQLNVTVQSDFKEKGELFILFNDKLYSTDLIANRSDLAGTEENWKMYTVQANAKNDVYQCAIGVRLKGTGSLWIRDISLKTQTKGGEWEVVYMNKSMTSSNHSGLPAGWKLGGRGAYYNHEVDTECSACEGTSLRINSYPQLFEEYPKVGETIVSEIGDELWSEVPLALYRNEEHTLPRSNIAEFEELQRQLNAIYQAALTADDENVRLANIIITWNIFQHFYPYFNVIDTDWERQLTLSLQRAMADQTTDNFYITLQRMLATLQDGHISVRHPSIQNSAGFPFIVDWIEGHVVVTHSLYEDIRPGDIIQTVDGTLATKMVKSEAKLISGSPQLSLFRSLRRLGSGGNAREATVVVNQEGVVNKYTIPLSSRSSNRIIEKAHLPVIGEIEEGIFYVDLDQASMDQIEEKIDSIATSSGVIFDLRGYPNSNHQILSHLLTEADTSSQWMQIPQIIYPDHKNIVGYQTSGWHLQPASPHIQGKVVFITDARAISYAESFLSFVEHYKLGDIVGQPTAGTNGNVNHVTLPGGYRFAWTGMKVVKHDGSQHHLIGIQPTVPVEKTIEGVRAGKDEFLEKAIEIIQ